MPVVEVSDLDEFNKLVKEETAVVVDFFADWCGPCKMISPFFKELSDKYLNVKFVKVNVDDAEDIAAENGITAMPTFLFFKNGVKNNDIEVKGAGKDKLEASVKVIAA